MHKRHLAAVFASGLLTSAHADLLHHYTFDSDTSDSGTNGADLVLGTASSLTTSNFRVGSGALSLNPALATDTRPDAVPAGVPAAGDGTHGWDGASSYVNVDPDLFADGDTRTLAAWLWIDPDGANDIDPVILAIGTTPDQTRHNVRLQNVNGNWILRTEIQSTYARILEAEMTAKTGLTTLADGQWHHVAVVVPNNTSVIEDTILYIDGVAFSGDVGSGGDLEFGTQGLDYLTGVGPIHVGDGIFNGDRDFDGAIDDVRIYDEALDATAIQGLVSGAGAGSMLGEINASTAESFAGQAVTLSWDVFDFETLEIDQGIGDVSGLTIDGFGSVTVNPLATTTYTLTGTRGGGAETESIEVTVDVVSDPSLGMVAAPPYADGSVPAVISWQTPEILREAATGEIDSLTGGGTIVTDAAADFATDLASLTGGGFVFEIDAPYFLDQRAEVASFTGTELTLASPVGTTFDTSITVLPNEATANNERCYEAYNAAAQQITDDATGSPGTRWANCANPTFVGNNGAAEFEDASGAVTIGTLESVSDPAVPIITEAYRFGDSIGKARAWYGAPGVHENAVGTDSTMEVWFKPDGLTNGEQIIWEFGGNGRGTYLGLNGDTLVLRVVGNTGVSATHTLTDTDWHHAVARFHITNDAVADDFAELFLNGDLVATTAIADLGSHAGGDDAGFGGVEGSYAASGGGLDLTGGNADLHFEGLIARIALYNRALTEGEIAQNLLAITQDAVRAQDFVGGSSYSVSESLAAHTIAIDDDDPATSPSPLYTTSDPTEVGGGSFTTPFNVATTTTYTVTATAPGGSSMKSSTVTIGGAGDSWGEAILGDAPIAWYRFDEGAGSPAIFDSSEKGEHSTVFTGLLDTGATGPLGGALELGGDQTIEIALDFNPQDPDGDDTEGDVDPDDIEGFTIEAIVWDDLDINTGNRAIASQQDLNGTGRVGLEKDGATEGLRSFLGGSALISPNRRLSQAWCHYAIVCEYQPSTFDYTLTMYRDGEIDTTFEAVLIEPSEGRWVLSIAKAGTSDWIGLFDEIAFYDTALSQAQLQNHVDAFVADSQIGILAFGSTGPITIAEGDSVDLIAKIGGSASGSIDIGGGLTADPGTTVATVSPTETTTYTLTLGGESRSVTVTVLPPVRILETGINAGGFFFVTVQNLSDGQEYEMLYSPDLSPGSFQSTGFTANGAGANPVTFTDTVPHTIDTKTFYVIEAVVPPAP